ncbi:Protein of unknown function [Pyronema omphalodes CBS 100304]|uniref:Uncharacterized protein n=1 Tax=Pyronema omphalodes (strain CBS 100304) TaxID=1076935 RepID=U4L4Y9_PYROM|nr:Protein of unknown function [Pyronema omphalodes CBS 100304]
MRNDCAELTLHGELRGKILYSRCVLCVDEVEDELLFE